MGTSSFNELLKCDNYVSIHHRNAIELFKVKLGVPPPYISKMFCRRYFTDDCVVKGLRSQVDFYNYKNPMGPSIKYVHSELTLS